MAQGRRERRLRWEWSAFYDELERMTTEAPARAPVQPRRELPDQLRLRVLAEIEQRGPAIKKDIHDALGNVSYGSLEPILRKMVRAGELVLHGGGTRSVYAVPVAELRLA